MNLQPIITPNAKGQLVIPVSIRKALNLKPSSPLQVSTVGNHIVLKPIKRVITADTEAGQLLDALKQTAGSWAGDPDPLAAKHEFELQASLKRQQLW
jgi:AbrB family looped-hinge helix DNA binding protein